MNNYRDSIRISHLYRFLILLLASTVVVVAQAATYTLPMGTWSGPFSSCSLTSGTTYSCTSSVLIGNNDTVNFTQSMTLAVIGSGNDFEVGNNSILNGNGYSVTITAADDIKLGNSFLGTINLSAGDDFEAGNSTTITGNVTAVDDVKFGNSTDVTGDVTAGDKLTVGSGTINGNCAYSTTNYTCTSKTLSISSASVTEGNSGTKTMTFTVTLSTAATSIVTVNYATSNGTATGGTCGTAGVDYATTTGTATIPIGSTTKTFTVSVCGDTTYEGDESFTVTLTSPVNATVPAGADKATGAILNDDPPPLVAEYRFDEAVWNGTSGDVKDSSGNGYHALSALATTATGAPGPAYTLGAQSTCRYGVFDGGAASKSYVQLPGTFPGLPGSFSLTAWINSSNVTAQHQRIFVRDDADDGWALSLADGTGTGILRFFNRNVTFTSPTGGAVSAGGVAIDTSFQLSSDTWYFVALTVDTVGKTAVMYAYDTTGAQKSRMSASFTGTWGAGTGATAIGGETSASSEGRQTSWHFLGRIDEVRVYSGALTQTLVEALLPTVRPCVAVDHVRIEHDGQGLSCQSETLTVKACATADAGSPAACTAYTGGITGNVLVKSGASVLATVPFTIASGSSSTTVSAAVASAPGVTFETSALSITPGGASAWTCWNSATASSSCAMAVSACASGGFNCLDSTITPYSLANARLYTKLAGTNFNFDMVALNASGAQESNYAVTGGITRQVTVELFDDTTPAASCSAYSGPVFSKAVTLISTDGGRQQIANVNLASAYKKLVCRVTDTTGASPVYGCSSDDFSVRPLQLTVSAPVLSNTALTGTPKAIAGSAFTLTAAAGVAAGYTGTPALDGTKVQDHFSATIATGTLSGVFSAGTGSSASGATFKYLDVGNIKFLADAVVDSGFTNVDQVGDCVAGSTSNAVSSDKYGCNIGSAASAAAIGRWYPSHYSFAGTLTPACNGFTYMDQHALGVALTLKAHATLGGTAAATDPVVSRYTTGYTNLAPVTISGYDDATTAAVSVTRLGSPLYPALPVFPAFPTMPNTALWNAGMFTINDSFAFMKLATPDGPYEQFKLKVALTDPDASALIGLPAAQETNTTKVRYGRVQLKNAYGSELLALPIPMAIEYVSSSAGPAWSPNSLDTCSNVTNTNFSFNFSTPAGTVTKPNHLIACETALTVTGSAPNQKLSLSKPCTGIPCAGNDGWARVTLNLGTSMLAASSQCTAVGSVGGNDVPANMPWLQFPSGSNPSSFTTFGIYKSPLIYRRENY